jgi:hypothetical protein
VAVAISTLTEVQEELPDPRWARTQKGNYHRLLHLDPEANGLTKANGVYVVWHGGINPGWIFIGRSADLAQTFHQTADDEEVMAYDIRGGIFVTWALIKPEFQDGVVHYLNATLRPKIKNDDDGSKKTAPVPVLPPRPKSASR